jgi:hypothetical protein
MPDGRDDEGLDEFDAVIGFVLNALAEDLILKSPQPLLCIRVADTTRCRRRQDGEPDEDIRCTCTAFQRARRRRHGISQRHGGELGHQLGAVPVNDGIGGARADDLCNARLGEAVDGTGTGTGTVLVRDRDICIWSSSVVLASGHHSCLPKSSRTWIVREETYTSMAWPARTSYKEEEDREVPLQSPSLFLLVPPRLPSPSPLPSWPGHRRRPPPPPAAGQ